MDSYTNDPAPQHQLVATEQIKEHILKSTGWAKFLSILGFIVSGLLLLLSLLFFFLGGYMIESLGSGPQSLFAGPFMGVFYLIAGIFYLFPALFLYRYADRIKEAVLNTDQSLFENAFLNLKKLFIYLGIYALIVIGIYVIGFIAVLFIGIAS